MTSERNNTLLRLHYFKVNPEECQMCHATDDVEIHHIIPLAEGGTNDFENLMALCHKCHRQVHAKNHSALTKLGIARARAGKQCSAQYIHKIDLLEAIATRLDDGQCLTAVDVIDIILDSPIRWMRDKRSEKCAVK